MEKWCGAAVFATRRRSLRQHAMAAVTALSLTVASLGSVRARWNSPMHKRILIWVPAFAILAIALVTAATAPTPLLDPPAEQRAYR
jgi:hypothetical protein